MTKAVLFDMDGVLYDSMPGHARSWHASMAEYGITMAPEEAYTYEGMRGVETIRLLARRQWGRELTEAEAQSMYRRKTELFAQCPPARIMPGAREAMERIARLGWQIVIVTGSGQHTLLAGLTRDFAPFVRQEKIVSALDVSRGKPAPDPYLKGLERAGAKPEEAIVIENAPLGVRSAVAAGIRTIAINTGPLPDNTLLQEGACTIVHSYEDIDFDQY